eukprot:SM000866S23305  [mRNA]  locus=s866:1845:2233:- [translate_table: standard]
MAKVADVAYKAVTAGLALATVWFGANLVYNFGSGVAWHLSHPPPPKEGASTLAPAPPERQ